MTKNNTVENNQKKLLLLGGSDAQLIAITTAKKLGYYTIVCDYLKNNPGQHIADKFYLESTTNKDEILSIAKKENIDGIIAYGSDPAAPTAAYVAEKLKLPGIPYKTAKSFCEKPLFRQFLKDNDFNVPKCKSFIQKVNIDIPKNFNFPVIVKPSDASGSKGVTVLKNKNNILKAAKAAKEYSHNGKIIIEEFIKRNHEHVIEGEIFVANGKVSSWGLINSIRDTKTNPLLPAAYTYPLKINPKQMQIVKNEIQRLITSAEIKYGACNLEMIINDKDQLYFLDCGPRNGGNQLPEFIESLSNKKIVEASIYAAMGEYKKIDVGFDEGKEYWGLAVYHSDKDGLFKKINYSKSAKDALQYENIAVKPGDTISKFNICSDLLGLGFYKFKDISTMNDIMENSYVNMNVEVYQ